ncbi:methylthioribose-1-phosphate isomerase-like [Hibiscus syriacus]|uniref:methylthioribose-1-phosphate isomerase-like n=1 Tax=Hibiscus syriacus TaxID=106335 RepID=UPI001924A168|nr:methylthioribose-1-phosphate isomerase-like [Hibiscus syriacus]
MAPDSKSIDGTAVDNTLQAICYKRGSLQLLDQIKLPLETVYLDIQGSIDGWNAIRDMVVRGAPAMATAAALSLAVEIANLMDFKGTSKDAASFLETKLEYCHKERQAANLHPSCMHNGLKIHYIICQLCLLMLHQMSASTNRATSTDSIKLHSPMSKWISPKPLK